MWLKPSAWPADLLTYCTGSPLYWLPTVLPLTAAYILQSRSTQGQPKVKHIAKAVFRRRKPERRKPERRKMLNGLTNNPSPKALPAASLIC